MRPFLACAALAILIFTQALGRADDANHDAWSLNKEGVRLTKQKKWADSIPMFEKALALAGQTPNFDQRHLGEIHFNLGIACWNAKEIANSIRELEVALTIDQYSRSLAPFNLASLRIYLGDAYNRVDRFADAARVLEAALPEIGSHYGTDSPHYGWVLAGLGKSYYRLGRFQESRREYEQSLQIYTTKHRTDDVITLLAEYGNMYWSGGYYQRAEELFTQAIQKTEEARGADAPSLVTLLADLSGVYRYEGQNWRRDPIYDRMESICQKWPDGDPICAAGGTKRPMMQALLEADKGNYARAVPLFRAQMEKLQDTDLTQVDLFNQYLLSATGLIAYYRQNSASGQAIEIHQKLLTVYERYSAYHSRIAYEQYELAQDFQAAGYLNKAEALYAIAVPELEKDLIRSASAESKAPQYLARQLADYYAAHNQMQRAIANINQNLEQTRDSVGASSSDYAGALYSAAMFYDTYGPRSNATPLYEESERIYEQQLGSDSPFVGNLLIHLTMHAMENHHYQQANALLQRVLTNNEANFSLLLTHGSEDDRRAALNRYSSSLDLAISLQDSSPQALEQAFLTLLSRKGRLIEISAEGLRSLRAQGGDKNGQLLDDLAQTRALRATLILHPPAKGDMAAYVDQLYKLRLREDELEQTAVHQNPGNQPNFAPASLTQLQAHVAPQTALIEMTLYSPFDADSHRWNPARAMAYVARSSGPVRAFDLGPASQISAQVKNFRNVLHDSSSTHVQSAAQQLYQTVLSPLESALEGADTLYLSPDGDLNLIPFAALIGKDNHYLFESYAIYNLTAGRDILQQWPAPSDRQIAIFANPAYGDTRENSQAVRAPGPRSFNMASVTFPPLPGTAKEAAAIQTLVPESELFQGAEATETALKALHSPSILHIATHGFFLPDVGDQHLTSNGVRSDASPIIREDPLVRSGLALACVNVPCGGTDDGILTALEATTLDLEGTQLVVLSACDTGLGDVVNGDGVYGLRRAFFIAGARRQVMSLWKVDDLATSDLMTAFYAEIVRGASPQDALRTIQRKWAASADRSHPFYWASFVITGL